MSIQPQRMEIDYLYANFVEGSIWRGLSSHCGRVPFLLQALRNKSLPSTPEPPTPNQTLPPCQLPHRKHNDQMYPGQRL